jgi:hypothetical protein
MYDERMGFPRKANASAAHKSTFIVVDKIANVFRIEKPMLSHLESYFTAEPTYKTGDTESGERCKKTLGYTARSALPSILNFIDSHEFSRATIVRLSVFFNVKTQYRILVWSSATIASLSPYM